VLLLLLLFLADEGSGLVVLCGILGGLLLPPLLAVDESESSFLACLAAGSVLLLSASFSLPPKFPTSRLREAATYANAAAMDSASSFASCRGVDSILL